MMIKLFHDPNKKLIFSTICDLLVKEYEKNKINEYIQKIKHFNRKVPDKTCK